MFETWNNRRATGSVFEEQRDEILGAGCDELVCKPVREEEILDAIGRRLVVRYKYVDVEQPAVPESTLFLDEHSSGSESQELEDRGRQQPRIHPGDARQIS